MTSRIVDLPLDVLPGEAAYEPRDEAQGRRLLVAVDRLLATTPDIETLDQLERELFEATERAPMATHLAVKLARSKAVVRALDGSLHVTVVFAVYKENTRMLPPSEHPHGEDCIVRKVEQMRWLFDGSPVTWSLVVVDDGCPDGSGHQAARIAADRCPGASVRVLFLDDAIAEGLEVTRPLQSAADSRKGGSIVYGMWAAARENHERHVVVFTDADLSTHLGQLGLLIEGTVVLGNDSAIGSRREPTSVVVKEGHRNTRGKLFIYLWKGLIRPLHYITDTQCGFKAFTAETLLEVTTDLIEKQFAFDIELLLRTELRRRDSIVKIPVAWIDSEAASTTTGLEPYLAMLQAVAAMYRRYLPGDPESDALAELIESMTEEEWQYLSQHVPEPIAEGDPLEFGSHRPVAVDELKGVVASRNQAERMPPKGD